jgi:hypothetical protein
MITTALGNHFRRAAIVCAALALAGIAHAQTWTYRLTHNASYSEGCFELCACPIWFSSMTGRFRLTPETITGTYDVYSVTDVNWNVTGTNDYITGSGTYTVFSEFAVLNRMELDLSINGAEPIHFDSGMVPIGAPWPRIEVEVAMNGDPACYDIRMNVAAKRVRGDINSDGLVNIDDLLSVINQWGQCADDGPCAADITPTPGGNGEVDVDDLLTVINDWG